MAHPTRVLIADDSTRARGGLRALLVIWSQISVIGEATNGAEAVRLAGELQPDIVLMDLHMPVLDGIGATRSIKQQWPAIQVIALTMYASEQPVALQAGADAFVVKGSDPMRLLAMMGVNDVADGLLPQAAGE